MILSGILLGNAAWAQTEKLGIFEEHTDIGNPEQAGSAQYHEADQTYTLQGSGYNIWFERDEFHYLYQQRAGDFTATAQFAFVGEGGDPHRKTGWMIRETLADTAVHVSAVSHGDGLTVLQWRTEPGAMMRDPEDEIFFPDKNFEIVQLERSGQTITMRVGHPGEDLQEVGSYKMERLPEEVYIGLFVCSHNPEEVEEVAIREVSIVRERGFLSVSRHHLIRHNSLFHNST